MSEKSTNGGPNIGLLLLIPAAAIVARAAMRHHQMMWGEMGEPGSAAPFGRHGQGRGHRHFAGPGFDGSAKADFRLPPRIEWMLETWHERAHQTEDAKDEAPSA